MRKFDDLSEREILALAISNEEEDARIFADFADGLHDDYPASAKVFDEMAAEENGHRRRLIDLFVSKFGEHISAGAAPGHPRLHPAKPVWHQRPLGIDTARSHARDMERAAARFYRQALTRTNDASTRKLLGDLAEAKEEPDAHLRRASAPEEKHLTPAPLAGGGRGQTPRSFSRSSSPLAGLMDGSVSTLAPVFAAAFATHHTWIAFIVGLAASSARESAWGLPSGPTTEACGPGEPLVRGLSAA